LPAIAEALDSISPYRAPIAFASPNLLELVQMYQAARSDDLDLTAHPSWWSTIEGFSLGSGFRMNLEQLARRNVLDHDSSAGTLSFLVDEGVAQMAVNLLPFFQHVIIKCGRRGVIVAMRIPGPAAERSGWVHEVMPFGGA
jgi:pseudouridine-5'-phosphate glycosidase/pseudouridine kinase